MGLTVLGGLLLFASFPPLDQGWLAFFAIAPLVAVSRQLATRDRPGVRGLAHGLVAGLTFFGPLVAWLLPFGIAAWGLLVVIQAAFIGGFIGLMAVYGERRGRPAVAVALWVALEAIRASWPLGGFAWGVLGYSQHDNGFALGAARSVGVYGVSLLLAAVAVAAEEVVHAGVTNLGAARGADTPADALFGAMRTPLLTALGLLSLSVLLAGESPSATGQPTIDIGIAQAGDTRATVAAGVNRLDSERIERVASLALEATRPFAADPPDLLVWPENALDIDIRIPAGAPIGELLQEGLSLVQPSPILAGEYQAGPRPRTLYNQMTVFTQDGEAGRYRKRRPVPFGEYVPLRSVLGDLPPLRQIPSDTLPGREAQVIQVERADIGGIICFENTFPSLARDQVQAGANLLLVSTNNSSFGDTAMSAQHLAFSQLRAVETGRWVVHAGISGISGFISPDGVVMQRTPLFVAASPRMDVPLLEGTTLAVRLGGLLPGLAQLLSGIAFGLVAGQAASRRRQPAPPSVR